MSTNSRRNGVGIIRIRIDLPSQDEDTPVSAMLNRHFEIVYTWAYTLGLVSYITSSQSLPSPSRSRFSNIRCRRHISTAHVYGFSKPLSSSPHSWGCWDVSIFRIYSKCICNHKADGARPDRLGWNPKQVARLLKFAAVQTFLFKASLLFFNITHIHVNMATVCQCVNSHYILGNSTKLLLPANGYRLDGHGISYRHWPCAHADVGFLDYIRYWVPHLPPE